VELTFRIRSMHRIRQLKLELQVARAFAQQLERRLLENRPSASIKWP
jgi:hypothetical protein